MAVHIVTFTISSAGKGNRDGLRKALQDMGSRQIFETTHLVANWTAESIWQNCKPFLDTKTDYLFICKLANDKQGWMEKADWTWLNDRI